MDDIYDLRIGDGDGELVMEMVTEVVMVVVMKVMVMIMLGLFEMGCVVRFDEACMHAHDVHLL
jgi:hypothetical protein